MSNKFTIGRLQEIRAYEPGKRTSEVREELGLTEIVKLSSNESPFPPMERARLAMAEALKGLNRYPDGSCKLIKRKLCETASIAPEKLMVGNGSNELLRLLAQVLLEPGDQVVMATPSFVVYPLVTKLMGADQIEVPLKDFTHDLDRMSSAITDRTKLVFVCNPNNPTGTTVDAATARKFLDSVPGNVVVCFDEAYHEYVENPAYSSFFDLVDEYHNLVVFRTFSKIYGLAGTRIGYGVGPVEIVEAVDKIREPFNINIVAQVGAYYSLQCQAEVELRRRQNAIQKAVVSQELTGLGFTVVPSDTNFLYIDCGDSAAVIFDRLQRQGVIVRAFGSGNFIRATVGTESQNERFVEAMARLRNK